MKVIYSVCLIVAFFISCNNSSKEVAPAQADADSTTVISVPVAIPEERSDSSIQDSVFSDGSIPASWENAGIKDPSAMIEFIRSFQKWTRNNLSDSIAANMNFPTKKWKTKSDFINAYPTVFTDSFKLAIAKQNLRQVFRNQNGAMIADGKVWFVEENGKVRISAINP